MLILLHSASEIMVWPPSRDFFRLGQTIAESEKEANMEMMTAHDADLRYPPAPRSAPRRVCAATVVAALYGLLVLGAPFLIRYGPDLDFRKVASTVATAVTGRDTTVPRCASAPEFGYSCPSGRPVAARRSVLAATTR